MTTTFDIPGGVGILRDPSELTERGRRLIQTALMPLQANARRVPASVREAAQGDDVEASSKARTKMMEQSMTTRQDAAAMLEVRDAAMVALLKDWTRDEPLPTLDNLLDLDHDTFVAIENAASPFVQDVLRISMPTNFGPNPGRDTPFDESSTSNTGSKAGGRQKTPRPRTRGGNTSTAGTSGRA